jgi:predicted acylesterase/phospholipase RssA
MSKRPATKRPAKKASAARRAGTVGTPVERTSQARPRIGLALAGGGPLGAIYEIGALAALSESLRGIDLNDADVYVGVSAGGFIAAGIVNGFTPHQMSRPSVGRSL